jgi:hypothetical protein
MVTFPKAETIPLFAFAFMDMMFAHAEFEEQVRVLQASIMKTPANGPHFLARLPRLSFCPKKKRRRPWDRARTSKTHGKADQGSPRFGRRPRGKADR